MRKNIYVLLVIALNTSCFFAQTKDVEELNKEIDVPFAVIDNIPQFDNCEKSWGKESRDCFY
ncbi:hypothetical protein [uncultured Flavobacterium sp.]|uniref:hypothetical protein n=1 Tax=uncultured Flavobacterium sp. TaxID=165435 RepID=UPI0030ECDB35|tara:strand:- start:452 stop:637 length:186 start_codon:yes stop_codon:yes gene_type:complete